MDVARSYAVAPGDLCRRGVEHRERSGSFALAGDRVDGAGHHGVLRQLPRPQDWGCGPASRSQSVCCGSAVVRRAARGWCVMECAGTACTETFWIPPVAGRTGRDASSRGALELFVGWVYCPLRRFGDLILLPVRPWG